MAQTPLYRRAASLYTAFGCLTLAFALLFAPSASVYAHDQSSSPAAPWQISGRASARPNPATATSTKQPTPTSTPAITPSPTVPSQLQPTPTSTQSSGATPTLTFIAPEYSDGTFEGPVGANVQVEGKGFDQFDQSSLATLQWFIAPSTPNSSSPHSSVATDQCASDITTPQALQKGNIQSTPGVFDLYFPWPASGAETGSSYVVCIQTSDASQMWFTNTTSFKLLSTTAPTIAMSGVSETQTKTSSSLAILITGKNWFPANQQYRINVQDGQLAWTSVFIPSPVKNPDGTTNADMDGRLTAEIPVPDGLQAGSHALKISVESLMPTDKKPTLMAGPVQFALQVGAFTPPSSTDYTGLIASIVLDALALALLALAARAFVRRRPVMRTGGQ